MSSFDWNICLFKWRTKTAVWRLRLAWSSDIHVHPGSGWKPLLSLHLWWTWFSVPGKV